MSSAGFTKQTERWVDRTGGCIKDTVSTLGRTVRETDDGSLVLAGISGEVGRAHFAQSRGSCGGRVSPRQLLAILGFSDTPFLLRCAEKWLDELPGNLPAVEILDLAYIEQRLSGWAGPSVYGHEISTPTLTPFNCARQYASMLSLPFEYRCNQRFAKDFIGFFSPKLAAYPFNRATGISKLLFPKQELKALLPRTVISLLTAH